MMQRKVQLTGSSTLAVSLPKAWAKRFNIKPQMPLFLREGPDGSLTVSRQPDAHRSLEATFDLGRFPTPDLLRRAFIAKYLAGATTFSFASAKPIPTALRVAVLEQARLLPGLEIVEERPEAIHVQDFFSPRSLSLEKALQRTHDFACSMQETLSQVLESGDAALASGLSKKEDEVDRLRFLVLRLLGASLNNSALLSELKISAEESLLYAEVIRCLEKMADEAAASVELLKSAPDDKETAKARVAVRMLNEQALALQKRSLQAFFAKDAELANAVLSDFGKLRHEHALLGRKLAQSHAPYEMRAVGESVMAIARKGADVAETALDAYYAQHSN